MVAIPRWRGLAGALVVAMAFAAAAEGQEAKGDTAKFPTVAEKTKGLERVEGLLAFYPDPKRGKLWLELPPAGEDGSVGEYLYLEGLLTGLGSNPVGLDRGQLGDARLVRFERVGGKLLIVEPNLRFRAYSDDPAERRAVRESFAPSVLWGGPLVAESADGTALVDFSSFVVRDAHGVVATLRETRQGSFKLDPARSAIDLGELLAFPDNVELESVLTYVSDKPGELVDRTAPDGTAMTVVLHQSFVRLPDDGYRPRRADPRAGTFKIRFADYAVPLDQPIEQQWVIRHRLEKVNPDKKRSEVREPIVFYVDSGAPEPVRSALVEGASWWAEAFDAAGLVDAYRVEVMPEDMHPLDVRYNVVQWVHRSTRGWSYGGGIVDPRTGEQVKGHVTLGSLRVRQDRLLFEGLAGVAKTGSGAADDPVELALARIRQLAAHEVGHAIGIAHNFAASTYDGRASVMDYPAPLVGIDDQGELDFSNAYGVGIGSWDKQAVRYAYSQFPAGADEAAELEAIVRDGIDRGLLYVTDEDARPSGAAHPLSNLWDNGSDPVEELHHTLRVRRIALDRFGEDNLAAGRPMAHLEEVLVPLYLHHRYQLDAAVKSVGGATYRYGMRGDGQPGVEAIPAERQRAALAAVLEGLEPFALDLPENVLAVMAPRPDGERPNRELFRGHADPLLDPLAAAATAASMVVDGLLDPARAARLVDLERRDSEQLGLGEVLSSLVAKVFDGTAQRRPRLEEVRRTTQWVVVDGLIDLARSPAASPAVRREVESRLRALAERLGGASSGEEGAQRAFLHAEIERFLLRRGPGPEPERGAPRQPPGSPIGGAPPWGACSHGG